MERRTAAPHRTSPHRPDEESRQTAAHQGQRQLTLSNPVRRSDQRLEARLVEELDLVEQEDDAGARLARRLPQLHQEVAQILLQVAGVGDAGEGLDVDGELHALRRPDRERLQDAQRTKNSVLHPLDPTHRLQHPSRHACHERPQIGVMAYLAEGGNQPRSIAMSSTVVRRTVLPTPRKPEISMLRSGFPRWSRRSRSLYRDHYKCI